MTAWIVAVPLLVGTALMLLDRRVPGRAAAWAGAATSGLALLLVVVAGAARDASEPAGEVDHAWIEPLGARLHLGLDEISLPFAVMTALLGLLCCLWLVARDTTPALVGLVLVVTGSALGVFAAMDLLVFFVFFELALVPMWFVIAWWGSGDATRAATRFLLFTVTGSALLLAGIVAVGVRAGTLQIAEVAGADTGRGLMLAAAVLVALGLAVKTPVVPLHTWLPDAHSAAPTVGSVLLAGVFLKLGTYGLIRLSVEMLPASTARIAPVLAAFGVLGILWAGLACYAQDDLKRLVAFSSVGHMGFVVLGLATMSPVGTAAAVIGSVAHGLITGLLFLVAGALKDRHGTTSLAVLGRGLYGRSPWLAVVLVFACVASLGLPGLAGFWGEVLALRATYEHGVLEPALARLLLVGALVGVVLATAYLARVVRLLAQGEPEARDTDRDLGRREAVVLGVLVAAVVVVGLWPGLVVADLGVTR